MWNYEAWRMSRNAKDAMETARATLLGRFGHTDFTTHDARFRK